MNIAKIIDKLVLDKSRVAAALFPDHKHPMLALKRLMNGDSVLTYQDIERLSKLVNRPIEELQKISDE